MELMEMWSIVFSDSEERCKNEEPDGSESVLVDERVSDLSDDFVSVRFIESELSYTVDFLLIVVFVSCLEECSEVMWSFEDTLAVGKSVIDSVLERSMEEALDDLAIDGVNSGETGVEDLDTEESLFIENEEVITPSDLVTDNGALWEGVLASSDNNDDKVLLESDDKTLLETDDLSPSE